VNFFGRAFGAQVTTMDGGYTSFRQWPRARPPLNFMCVTFEEGNKPRVIQRPDIMLRAMAALNKMAAYLTDCEIRQGYLDNLKIFVDAHPVIVPAINHKSFEKMTHLTFEQFMEQLEGTRSYVGDQKRSRQEKKHLRDVARNAEHLAATLNEEMIAWIKGVLPIVARHAPRRPRRRLRVAT
jgi:hypothetical protein